MTTSEGPDLARPVNGPDILFAVASCQYPPGLLDIETAYASYRRLESRLPRVDQNAADGRLKGLLPDGTVRPFLLQLGDQVYVDSTAGLFDPTRDGDRYETPYRRLKAHLQRDGLGRYTETWKQVDNPDHVLIDDHEIADNWEPSVVDEKMGARELHQGLTAFLRERRRKAPPYSPAARRIWHHVPDAGFPLFLADTRTEREARTPKTLAQARIMGCRQEQALKDWLLKQARDAPKIIASPSIFLPRHAVAVGHPANALRSDGWDGYPRSLHSILSLIASQGIRKVVFLSGDEHLSCISHITLRCPSSGGSVVVHSIHSSPLYAPYPFANSIPEDLLGVDRFEFHDPEEGAKTYECSVSTQYPGHGDGFAIVSLTPRSPVDWDLGVEFSGERVTKRYRCAL